ncbi:MAG: U32 family peptidase, partial [Bacteroidia bacterium]|nr:U32 family peptidase [Bacteroidia bacterium]
MQSEDTTKVQLRKLEILAPAKNRGIGIAAINCGADSLYIAGPAFGAREAAGNSFADIEKLTSYARKFGVKVYVVINTILYQNELEQAVSAAKTAYESGADALIVQDLGLLETELPPLPLFASTQTNIRSAEQAQLLESLGFSRLILARELSLEQIAKIRAATSIELESFVHGALCVSYSGQC